MTARLRRVLVRAPAPPSSADDWREFGYGRPVAHAIAHAEHQAFVKLLVGAGVEVIQEGPDDPGQLDAIFAYDPSFMTDEGAILLRMGKPLRLGETALAARVYAELGIPILGQIEEPGTAEGGDMLWLDERTLAVGLGYRTNRSGIDQLRTILATIDVEVIEADLPHWRGSGECLHLMSLMSPVAADLAVVYLPLMAVGFLEELRARYWRYIEVPEQEFDTLACNVLTLEPSRCLTIEGNPITRSRLEAAGCEVLTYAGHEISLNRAGGPTCLTRPIWRREG
ncbi:MAG: arginine deiminase family protein [Chloroflexota bacterium]|nr:arginine deiminase family protein [Chloroflexota bacterium]